MQTKLFAFLASLLLLPAAIKAQRTSMTVYVPQTSGAAVVTGNGVNLRKSPSTSAPQLVTQMDAEMEGSDEIPENVWSNTPLPRGYGRSPYQLYEGKTVVVVKESDGWSQLIIDDMLPWAKNTFLSQGVIEKLGAGIPPADYSPRVAWGHGLYEDFCVVFYPHELFGHRIFLGYYYPELFKSHLAVFPLSVECFTAYNPNIKGITIKKSQADFYEVTFGPDAAFIDSFHNYQIDLSKLTDIQFKKLLDISKVDDEELIIYAFQGYTHEFLLSPTNYQGTMTKHEIAIPSLSSNPQTENTIAAATIFDTCDTPPSFPGGLGEMMSWLGRNMQYPPMAAENGIMGRVLVKFVVSADGSIRNAQVVKGVHPELDKEALRLVSGMPRWNPGVKNGHSVNSYYTVPITFKLNH